LIFSESVTNLSEISLSEVGDAGSASQAGEPVWILDGALELAAGGIGVAPAPAVTANAGGDSVDLELALEPDDLVRTGGDAEARVPAGKVS
jgi:hypothetical protein